MSTIKTQLPGTFHSAVESWQERFLPDFNFLMENWEKYFPKDERFELVAHRECGMCGVIEVGDNAGKPKYTKACDMETKQAAHLLGAVRAQAKH